MASVLRSPVLGSSQALGFSQSLPPDPEWEQRVAETEVESYARGTEEGRRQAAAELSVRLEALQGTLLAAVDRSAAAIREQIRADTDRVVALALELAESVTGSVPVPAAVLSARIEAALDSLEGADFIVEVHPGDVDVVTEALDDARCTVRTGTDLQPGEARVRGAWGHADLTREVAWTVLREAFDAD